MLIRLLLRGGRIMALCGRCLEAASGERGEPGGEVIILTGDDAP